MKTLADLEEIRKRTLERINLRKEDKDDEVRIVVGMATCGIAAGARPVMMSFMTESSKRHLTNVTVSQTGCIGMCRYEPMADVFVPGQGKVTYVNLDEAKARRIVSDHIVNGQPVVELMIGADRDKTVGKGEE
ncbi:MAG: (2Fe-2S) ferredoxin domain-containing protein [Eubacteriales bacterium]|jgi:NADP-reducing hydrogenase subunit HndB|nr:(2Fe-2S) ferredoxin domain-containing protein [Eubacteriales bacterium]NLV59804.1 (2Fe-2S) ferredoxin domain-containing protein [Clostridiales bacterium]